MTTEAFSPETVTVTHHTSRKSLVVTGVVMLALGAGAGYLSRGGEVNGLHKDVTVAQGHATAAQQDAKETADTLADIESQLAAAKSDLAISDSTLSTCSDALDTSLDAVYWLAQAAKQATHSDWFGTLASMKHVNADEIGGLRDQCDGGDSL